MAKPQAKSTIWEFLQSLGKTFMLPVALLAFSGILLGVGSPLTSDAVKQSMPFLDNTMLQLQALDYGNRIITVKNGQIITNETVKDLYAQLGSVWLGM